MYLHAVLMALVTTVGQMEEREGAGRGEGKREMCVAVCSILGEVFHILRDCDFIVVSG